ncbi:MAG: hypothetical protein QOJ97_2520 [Solirubrobacteraceae bacterium]|nr:hypothetical protein [Solirubrobacteraceae bacterium]
MSVEPPVQAGPKMDKLRDELLRRSARRYRRRGLRRWQRRRLLVRLLAVERDLEAATDVRRATQEPVRDRILCRLEANELKLYR